jgi:phage-related tail protein
MNTYLAATQTLADPKLPFVAKFFAVAAVIANGLSSVAKINNVQGFFKGTSSSPEGLAFVGERGAELMNVPGQGLMLSPSEATLTHLKRGTEIIPHEKSMAMLAGSGIDIGKGNDFLMLNHLQLVNNSVKEIGSSIVNAVQESTGRMYEQGSQVFAVQKRLDGSRKLIRLKSLSA